jgi:hypothetical protein
MNEMNEFVDECEPVEVSPRYDLLLLLAEELETQSRIPFDYTHWAGVDWQGASDLSCGTSACAAGIATTMKEFQDLGLNLVCIGGSPTVQLDDGCCGTRALASVFEIPYEDASYLFIPSSQDPDSDSFSPATYASARDVAEHIRKYVEKKQTT